MNQGFAEQITSLLNSYIWSWQSGSKSTPKGYRVAEKLTVIILKFPDVKEQPIQNEIIRFLQNYL